MFKQGGKMSNRNEDWNIQSNKIERLKKRRKNAARRRRRKKITQLICELCILVLLIVAVILCIQYVIKPTGNNPNTELQEVRNTIFDNIKTAIKTSESTFNNEQAAASQKIIRYSFERPKAREDEEIKTRISELCKKYPNFQEIYDNLEKYPNNLLAALGNNPDMIDYVKGYPTAEHNVSGGLTSEELQKKFPLFIQWDKRWGYADYGDDTIALSGCAPTCISMVAVALTKNAQATPDKVADYAQQNGYYQPNVGTAWNVMTQGAKAFGVQGTEMSLDKNKIFHELENGNPIICSMRAGDFTAVGHFIVLIGVKNGKLIVNDPNSTIRSNMQWDYKDIERQIKNLWVFHKI